MKTNTMMICAGRMKTPAHDIDLPAPDNTGNVTAAKKIEVGGTPTSKTTVTGIKKQVGHLRRL